MRRASLRPSGAITSIALVCALCAGAAVAAQVDYFLKISPIKGESNAQIPGGQIEIESLAWGPTQTVPAGARRAVAAAPGDAKITLKGSKIAENAPARRYGDVTLKRGVISAAAASSLPTGKRQHKPFAITQPVDKGSVVLRLKTARAMHELCTPGRALGNVTVQDGEATYELSGVTVVGCASVGAARGEVPTESISLNYEKIS